MAIGHHRMECEVLEGWQRLPEGWSFVEVAGVAVVQLRVLGGSDEVREGCGAHLVRFAHASFVPAVGLRPSISHRIRAPAFGVAPSYPWIGVRPKIGAQSSGATVPGLHLTCIRGYAERAEAWKRVARCRERTS